MRLKPADTEKAVQVRAAVDEIASLLAIDGEEKTASLDRAGVALGLVNPVGAIAVNGKLTANDKAALRIRETITTQPAKDWEKHFTGK